MAWAKLRPGFLYSGLARRKSALSLIFAVSASNAVVIFQWYFWGYSLAFSPSGTSGYIGDLVRFGLRNTGGDPSPGSPLIPDLLYSFYQMEFACVTVGILMGGVAERGRILPAMVFSFLWMTLVYCPLACWPWNINGWAFKWGVLDYAGGGPVEIGSGVGGLAFAWVLGRRKERELLNFRPHNVSFVALGTFLLWFGWLGPCFHPYRSHVLMKFYQRFQRRKCFRCQSPRYNGHLEFNARRRLWRDRLVPARLEIRKEVLNCRLLLWHHCRLGGSDSGVWVHSLLGLGHYGHRCRRMLQLCYKT